MKIFLMSVLILTLCACATGVSTYKYVRSADGSVEVYVKSANEVGQMTMGINRETGELEVDIGDMTKKSDTVEVVKSVKDIVHDLTGGGS